MDQPLISDSRCIICQTESVEQLFFTPCNHIFHLNCLRIQKLQQSIVCPGCAQIILVSDLIPLTVSIFGKDVEGHEHSNFCYQNLENSYRELSKKIEYFNNQFDESLNNHYHQFHPAVDIPIVQVKISNNGQKISQTGLPSDSDGNYLKMKNDANNLNDEEQEAIQFAESQNFEVENQYDSSIWNLEKVSRQQFVENFPSPVKQTQSKWVTAEEKQVIKEDMRKLQNIGSFEEQEEYEEVTDTLAQNVELSKEQQKRDMNQPFWNHHQYENEEFNYERRKKILDINEEDPKEMEQFPQLNQVEHFIQYPLIAKFIGRETPNNSQFDEDSNQSSDREQFNNNNTVKQLEQNRADQQTFNSNNLPSINQGDNYRVKSDEKYIFRPTFNLNQFRNQTVFGSNSGYPFNQDQHQFQEKSYSAHDLQSPTSSPAYKQTGDFESFEKNSSHYDFFKQTQN